MSAGTRHIPVMLPEVIEALGLRDGGVYIDATFGAGGYTRAMLEAANCHVVSFDRDPNAIADGAPLQKEFSGRLTLVNRPFAEIEAGLAEIGVKEVDGVVFDLGVSSMQLDQAERGFSFQKEGPLSMRMDGAKPDAADLVADADEKALASIFRLYGEERHAGRIARAIIAAREEAALTTTRALSGVIEKASPPRGASKIHAATRVFQALRIFVNNELGQLVAGLRAAEAVLAPAGRLIAVTFHSLEDRIVKRFLAARSGVKSAGSRHMPEVISQPPTFRLLSSKPRAASGAEAAGNARARSAKLRGAIRLDAAIVNYDDDALVPTHPSLFELNKGYV